MVEYDQPRTLLCRQGIIQDQFKRSNEFDVEWCMYVRDLLQLRNVIYVFVVEYDQPRTLRPCFLNKRYPWPWSVIKTTSNDIQQGSLVLMKVIWPLVALRCPRVTISGRIGLISYCSYILHQAESSDISDTFLRHPEVPQVIGTLVIPQKAYSAHITWPTWLFVIFFSSRPTNSNILNSILIRKV